MAAFTSNIDITSGGTYNMNITNGEPASQVANDLNGKFANIQKYLQNGLPEVWTGSSLPDSLPNSKFIIWNNNTYYNAGNAIDMINQPKTGVIKYIRQTQSYDFLSQMSVFQSDNQSHSFTININPLQTNMIIGGFQCYIHLSFAATTSVYKPSFSICGIINGGVTLYEPFTSGGYVSAGDYSDYSPHWSVLIGAQNLNTPCAFKKQTYIPAATIDNQITVSGMFNTDKTSPTITWQTASIDIIYTGIYFA